MYYIKTSQIALATFLLLTSACKNESTKNSTNLDTSSEQSKDKIVETIDFVPNNEVVVADVPKFVPPPAPVGLGGGFVDKVAFNSDDEDNYDLGTVGFRDIPTQISAQLWYEVTTPQYPNFVLLSTDRNIAAVQGDLGYNDSGFVIEDGGSYAVSFNAVVFADDDDDISGLNVFLLARSPDDLSTTIDTFDITKQVGTIEEIPYNTFVELKGNGILQNLTRGDYLSLVTNNIENNLQDIVVVAWTISVQRISNDQPITLEIPEFNITGNPFPINNTTPTEPAKEAELPIEAPTEIPSTPEEAIQPTESEATQPFEVTAPADIPTENLNG